MDSPNQAGWTIPSPLPSASVDSFDEVLEAARTGDDLAFGVLYEALNRRLHAFARVRGASDPEGLVNDVFLQVFTGLPTFKGTEGQFKAWVFKIARNKLIDEARKRQRRPIEAADERTDTLAVAAPDGVETEVVDRLGTESLLAHLHRLTDAQRDVLLLRLVSDLTIDTIAEVLGKRPGAVKALQRRALRTIAQNMSAEVVPL